LADDASEPQSMDLLSGAGGRGPVAGLSTEDLNVTLLAWPANEPTPEHVNAERDVLVVVLSGSGTLELDGQPHGLAPMQAVVIEKGRRRRIVPSADGIRYLSVHTARGGLAIRSLA
jgi:quercetin dioxygenase-like cupin family protein